ncbi:MAG: PD40 domain-containing protein [Planctomycetes bacterium]|nr:PD40 domain-containing protein [Planctomycetota bacterium]
MFHRTLLGWAMLLGIAVPSTFGQTPAASAQPADDEDAKKEEAKWDVTKAPEGSHDVALDIDEGTWMSVDVSPDGKELVFDLLGDLYVLPIGGGEATALTSGLAWDMQPRFSPDGKRIAFTSDAGGGDNLWTIARDGSDKKQVSKESYRLVNSPVWTPDGEYLAGRKHFSSHRSIGSGEIWLYHKTGGDGLQMTVKPNDQKDVGEPAFSPDGRYLYWSFDATPGKTFEYSKDSNGQIYAIDRLDRTTGEIVGLVRGPGGACRPTPSPDGKSLAFVRRVRFQSTLFVMDLASGELRPVFDGLERDMQETWAIHGVYPTMAWTPDSKALVLWAKGKFARVDVASGKATPIPFHVTSSRTLAPARRDAQAVSLAEFDVKCLRSVRVSPRGDRVVYQALGHLWIRALPEGTPERLTRDDRHFEYTPAFSRDGKSLVYATWNDQELGALWIVPLAGGGSGAGGEPRKLTPQPGHYVDPVFSPDGKTVVFGRVSGGGLTSPTWSRDTGVYAVQASGGEPELVTKKGFSPQFGAENERVYLLTIDEDGENDKATLFSIELDGSDERTHLESNNAMEFALSPDGKWVAFEERWRTYVAPFVATGRTVTVGPKSSSHPVAKVSRDSGENLQFSGDSTTLHWSLGPELFERKLADSFAFLAGTPSDTAAKLPEPPTTGRNISMKAKAAVARGAHAFVHARIVTMQGDLVIEDGALVVEGNRITAVGRASDLALPAGATIHDSHGLTIVPGLIDVHAHGPQAANGMQPQQNWASYANLAFGVTTIHDPSHGTNDIFSSAEMQRAGLIVAPRTFSTGTILYGAAGNFKAEVDSLDDARSHLRRLKAVGAFSVKSYNQPRRDQRQQVLAAAKELGMLVVPEGGSLFQHNLTHVIDGHTGVEHSLPVQHVYRDVATVWGASGVGYTPTLIVGYGGIWGENYFYDTTDVWKNERLMTFVPRNVVDPRSRRRTKAPLEEYNVLESSKICKAIVDAGGRVQLGAHGQLAGLGAHWELWLIQSSGLTNLQALRAATLDGARYIGMDQELGSLEVGKLADFLVLEANPLEDIRNSESIRYTVLDGRVFLARTMQELTPDGPGPKPAFYWQKWQDALPDHLTDSGCAGCGAVGAHAARGGYR